MQLIRFARQSALVLALGVIGGGSCSLLQMFAPTSADQSTNFAQCIESFQITAVSGFPKGPVTVSWTAVQGATDYYVRYVYRAASNNPNAWPSDAAAVATNFAQDVPASATQITLSIDPKLFNAVQKFEQGQQQTFPGIWDVTVTADMPGYSYNGIVSNLGLGQYCYDEVISVNTTPQPTRARPTATSTQTASATPSRTASPTPSWTPSVTLSWTPTPPFGTLPSATPTFHFIIRPRPTIHFILPTITPTK